jgi:hypothetical protein
MLQRAAADPPAAGNYRALLLKRTTNRHTMKLRYFTELLAKHNDKKFRMTLPDGAAVPMSYHVTEVAHVERKWIDCGGREHRLETCQLQVWVGEDDDHRLENEKLLRILEKAKSTVLPGDADALPVEIEYENGVLSQYYTYGHRIEPDAVILELGAKHTDCGAKDTCAPPASAGASAAGCCGGGKC